MKDRAAFNPSIAADRRRFYLDRAMRIETHGAGSDLSRLLSAPRKTLVQMPILDDLPVMLIGAHAAAVYAPERATIDVDLIVPVTHFDVAEAKMRLDGFTRARALGFPGSALGLRGSSWQKGDDPSVDMMTSDQSWLVEAFIAPQVANTKDQRVMPLPYLVLMKMDSARGIDQGDLTRILGRLNDEEVEDVVRIVSRYLGGSQAPEDVRQYARIGRWEYEST